MICRATIRSSKSQIANCNSQAVSRRLQVIRRKQQAASRPQAAPRCAEGASNGQRLAALLKVWLLPAARLSCRITVLRPAARFYTLPWEGARRCFNRFVFHTLGFVLSAARRRALITRRRTADDKRAAKISPPVHLLFFSGSFMVCLFFFFPS